MMMDRFEDMNDDDTAKFRKNLELEFFDALEKKEDIRPFLYVPVDYLTNTVKKHIDDFLLEEAYTNFNKGNINKDSFLVYQDSYITVNLDKQEQKLTVLQNLIDLCSKREEYEKCVEFQNLIKQLK